MTTPPYFLGLEAADRGILENLKRQRESALESPGQQIYRDIIHSTQPLKNPQCDFAGPAATFSSSKPLLPEEQKAIQKICRDLIPWRKGPFQICGEFIDAEWRSDLKWQRLAPALPALEDKRILDIGCNNGYFMFKMAQYRPRWVLGIDPIIHNFAQFHFLKSLASTSHLYFELFGIEHLKYLKNSFDIIFSMGILYHHRHPLEQLIDIRNSLAPGGTLILETIGIPGEDSISLFPKDRYAKMKNVWFLPTLPCLLNWVERANFVDIEVISSAKTTSEEQRTTAWCPPPRQSLEDFLDPNDQSKTIEGYPAPLRFCIKARSRGTAGAKGQKKND